MVGVASRNSRSINCDSDSNKPTINSFSRDYTRSYPIIPDFSDSVTRDRSYDSIQYDSGFRFSLGYNCS